MCLGVFLLGFIFRGTLCAPWTWLTISFPMLRKFSAIISSNIFSGPFSLSPPPGTPIMWMLVLLMLPQRSLRQSAFLFILFSIFCSGAVVYTILSFRSFTHSASVILLSIPSSVLFISVGSLFSSSKSLVSSFVFKFFKFIYLGLRGLQCCTRAFSSFGGQVLSSCGVRASHCSGYFCCGVGALGHTGFGSCASQALEHRLNSCGTRA